MVPIDVRQGELVVVDQTSELTPRWWTGPVSLAAGLTGSGFALHWGLGLAGLLLFLVFLESWSFRWDLLQEILQFKLRQSKTWPWSSWTSRTEGYLWAVEVTMVGDLEVHLASGVLILGFSKNSRSIPLHEGNLVGLVPTSRRIVGELLQRHEVTKIVGRYHHKTRDLMLDLKALETLAGGS